MKIHRVLHRPGIVIAALMLTGPLASFAAAPPGPDGGHDGRCGPPDFHDFRGPPGPGFGGFSRGGLGGPGFGPPPFLAGLHLTDEQQDKVFAIVYAAAPAMRDGEKALRKAHEALRDINASPEYDENHVKGLADSAAKADSQLTVLRVRTEHQIYAVLTPEQKNQLEERRREHGPGERGDHGDRHEHNEHSDRDDHKGSSAG